IDFGASFYHQGNRYLIKDRQQPITVEEYINFINKSIFEKYPTLMVTDPFSYDDWPSWQKFSQLIPQEIYLTGDELIASNKQRLEKAIKDKIISAVVIRQNQVGTVTDTLNLLDLAIKNQIAYIIASDLEETNDDFIADFSVAVGSEFINFGPPVHGENVAKYNRLLEIEKEIKK
ncbi:MAG: phosphopyruvate hydratase, partial [Microgenomates group bacterium]